MKIEFAAVARDVSAERVLGKNAVVIDVLRATSVIVAALANGAAGVKAFASVEEARRFAENTPGVVLGGERGGVPLQGFCAGNSPADYTSGLVAGKTVALTTTNGTPAIDRAKAAHRLYVMCFANVSSVARQLVLDNRDTIILCAGTDGRFSSDDSLCAAMCISLCGNAAVLDDSGRFLRDFYRMCGGDIKDVLAECSHVLTLQAMGFAADVEYCLQTDTTEIVPRLCDGGVFQSLLSK